VVTTRFTALPAASKLAQDDPAEMMNGDAQWVKTTRTNYIRPSNYARRGFRLGYVALLNDGSRQYIQQDSLYCQGTAEVACEVSMTVPAGTKQLWLVVLPAPTSYVQHKWDDNADNDDQWPYRFSLQGTTLGGRAQVYVAPEIDGREVDDITLTYDVWLPKRNSYDAVNVTVSGLAQAKLCTAFQLMPSDISDKMQTWATSGPSVGKMMFYPMSPKTQARVNRGSTANGYGHWFNASGGVSEYANGYLYSEFAPASLTFSIGQYPDKLSAGKDYTIGQILRYKVSADKEAQARFVFHVHITDGQSGVELNAIDYTDPNVVGIREIQSPKFKIQNDLYDLHGRRLTKPQRGFNIATGRKILMK
jgi:hypothetical protein